MFMAVKPCENIWLLVPPPPPSWLDVGRWWQTETAESSWVIIAMQRKCCWVCVGESLGSVVFHFQRNLWRWMCPDTDTRKG